MECLPPAHISFGNRCSFRCAAKQSANQIRVRATMRVYLVKTVRCCFRVSVLLLAAMCGASSHSAGQDAPPASGKIQSLVTSYCAGCHGAEKSEGELRLDELATRHWGDYDLFDEIVTRIEDGEMPPEDAKKPLTGGDKAALLALLKIRLTALDDAQLAGRYKKLTAQEYSNTLADVLGQPVEKVRNLPFDSDHDFKKIGEHQVVTSYAVKKYYDVAREYLDQHILVELPPVEETEYTPQDNPKEWVHTSRFNGTPAGPIAGSGNAPAFMLRNPVTNYATEGEYEIRFQWHCFLVPPKERFDWENWKKKYPPAEAANPPTVDCNKLLRVLNPVQQYKDGGNFKFECRIDQPIRVVLNKDHKFINFRVNNKSFRSREVDPRYAAIEKSGLSGAEKDKAIKQLRQTIKAENKDKPTHSMLITGATFRGPLNKQRPQLHRLVLGELKRDDSLDACIPIIRRLALQLFRRPVSDKVIDNYIAIARREHAETKNTFAAIKAVLNTMLCSPHFLFKNEGDQRDLDDYMIAARLSYFLTNSTPDDQLLALAGEGKLHDPAIRREQALRLLADRQKSERFTHNFTYQWLGLRKFGDFAPNEAYIRTDHFARLQPSIAQEPYAFFDEILFNNQSALNFIDSDFVVWDRNLYSHYRSNDLRVQLDAMAGGSEFQRMVLETNPGRVRGGLPTMASIMSLTTDGENQQPILRGVWIARRMLGMQIEPPATVPAIEINLANVSKPRDVLAKHKADRNCYVCHVKFDYLGLAMENYDVLGRYKTDYVHPVLDEKNRFQLVTKDPIDSLSETPGGKPMPGVAGLKSHLLEQKETVMRNLVERLFCYALGREVRYKDRALIDALLKGMRENDYRLQDAILALVASESFTRR